MLALVTAYLLPGANPVSAATTPVLSPVASPATSVGLQIFDNVILSGGANPTGSLTFNLFAPADPTCLGGPIFTSTVAVSGNGTYNSDPFTTMVAGTYRWVVSYSGDISNNPVGATSCSDPNQSVMVTKFFAALTTFASPGVAVGGTIHDTATLGGFGPTGTISFKLSGPTDTFCSAAPVFTATVPVNAGSGKYQSPDFAPTVPGTYRWQASYSGDVNNLIVPVTACLENAEAVVITGGMATPTISTTASPSVVVGGTVGDAATLSGGTSPTGTITFKLFGPNDASCAGAPAFTSITAVTGNGSYSSGLFTSPAAGTYHWTASYSGDGANNPVAGACGAANEDVSVTKANTAVVTTASALVTVGGTIGDTAVLSGGFSPTGTLTFNLFGPNDPTCTGATAFSTTAAVNGDGSYTSSLFTTLVPGTYRWRASYSGDANSNPAGPTACDDPAETVVVSPIVTTTTSSTTTTVPTTTTTTTSTTTTVPPTTTTSASPTTTTTLAPTTTTTSTTVPTTTTTSSTTTTTPTSTTTTKPSTTTTTRPTTTTTTTTTSTVRPSTSTSTTAVATTTATTGPTVSSNPSTVAAGQTTTVNGGGFPGGSQLFVRLFSDPVLLGTATANAAGHYTLVVTIPTNTTPGIHTLTVSTPSGTPQASTTLTVTAAIGAITTTTEPGNLSFTGADLRGPSTIALVLLVAGFLNVAIAYRRRREW